MSKLINRILVEITVLDFSPGSFLISFAPIVILILVFLAIRKKKQDEQKENNSLGRKGKKDHLWLIIKEYLQSRHQYKGKIEEYFVFPRPKASDLHEYLKKGAIFMAKQEAKERGVRYKRIKIPKVFEEEEYFLNLHYETLNLHRSIFSNGENTLIQETNPKGVIDDKRKRYVVIFKVDIESKGEYSWKCIEIEIIKYNDKEGKVKDSVVFNKELDFLMESKWILPLMDRNRKEREKEEKKIRKRENKKRRKG